jgi:tetratricopeptide (TPR) repeat protein
LLADEDASDPRGLDAHPLIREHFSKMLNDELPQAARAAHSRLFEYLKSSAVELPDNLEEMKPLYNAVTHGCRAGHHRDVAFGVLWGRILRGLRCYSMMILGATSSDLVAMANLFRNRDWTQPHPNLQPKFQAEALSYSGLLLLQMSRLDEALIATKQALEIAYGLKDMACAGRNARHISQIYMMKCEMHAALDYAKQYRVLAQRPCGLLQSDRLAEKGFAFVQTSGIFRKLSILFSIRPFHFKPSPEKVFLHEMASWTSLAHIFHLTGRLNEAAECFENAEEVQRTHREEKQLNSIWGYRYWELLYDQGRFEEIRERCLVMLKALEKNPAPIWGVGQADPAFAQIALVRCNIRLNLREEFDSAEAMIAEATQRFRESHNEWAIPDALMVKAELAIAQNEFDEARNILAEAELVAVRGAMISARIAIAVSFARLAVAASMKSEAENRLVEAEELIQKHEVKYQPLSPDWQDWDPPFANVFKPGDVIGHTRYRKDVEELRAQI